MGAVKEVVSRAKWLYAANAGNGIDDMKKYVKQAINEIKPVEDLGDTFALFNITYEEYVEDLAKTILEIM